MKIFSVAVRRTHCGKFRPIAARKLIQKSLTKAAQAGFATTVLSVTMATLSYGAAIKITAMNGFDLLEGAAGVVTFLVQNTSGGMLTITRIPDIDPKVPGVLEFRGGDKADEVFNAVVQRPNNEPCKNVQLPNMAFCTFDVKIFTQDKTRDKEVDSGNWRVFAFAEYDSGGGPIILAGAVSGIVRDPVTAPEPNSWLLTSLALGGFGLWGAIIRHRGKKLLS
jgi:hypothetical protein